MTQGVRPDGYVFASVAHDGELEDFPGDSLGWIRGWGLTLDGEEVYENIVTEPTNSIPPMEWMNGILNKLNAQILWNMHHAIPAWVAGMWDAESFVTYAG